MKLSHVALALTAAAALGSAVAVATLYGWKDAHRPPVSLAEALARADKLLGDDAANRYCVSVSLYGDADNDGKRGAWNLMYAAADGSKKHVYIAMDGKSDVKLWNGPVHPKEHEGRRAGVADVRRRLEGLFAREGIAAEFVPEQGGGLVARYRTRTFQVHAPRADGGHAEQAEPVPGPTADGIWIGVRVVDRPEGRLGRGSGEGPYWRVMTGTFLTTEAGKYLEVEVRCGWDVKSEIREQVWHILGDPAGSGD